MDRIRVVGGRPLNGTIPISGAKNATLPLMIASLLTDQTLILDNVPRLADVGLLQRIVACNSFEVARQTLKDETFDALITDVRLGAFNGLQLAVMARDMYPGIRLVVFSGFDDPVLRADAEQIGAVYLVKPVGSQDLLRHLDQLPS